MARAWFFPGRRELGPVLALSAIVAASTGCGGAAPPATRDETAQRSAPSQAAMTRTRQRAQDPSALGDRDIASAVERRVARDEAIPPNAVAVRVENGVVTLTGTVPHLLAADRARDIAERTRGVRAVVDRTEIRVAERADEELRADVVRALEVDATLDRRDLGASVERGVVTLEGSVRSVLEHRLAESLARGVRGVTRVENALRIEPDLPRSDRDIQLSIVRAMERDARIDPAAVEVRVEDGRVVLEGVVGSAVEREIARDIAAASGARDVDVQGLDVRWWARDELRRSGPVSSWTDDRIAAAVRDAVVEDPRVRIENVAVDVQAGIATVSGVVPSAAAKEAALETARGTVGVWRVVDRVEVRPAPAVEDEELERRVRAQLAASPWTAGAPIEIEAREGRVTLRGRVDARHQIFEAVHAATRVAGVREVDSELELGAGWEPLDDWELAAEIRDGLTWSPFLDRVNVRVEVEDGEATLRGDVDDLRAYREAEREAYEAGAVRVVNELTVQGADVSAPPARGPTPAPRR